MATRTLPPTPLDLVRAALASPEVKRHIDALADAHTTGRRGYGPRALMGCVLAKYLYPQPRVSRLVKEIRQNAAFEELLGCQPSDHAIYRFERKLDRAPEVRKAILDAQTAALRDLLPGYGDEGAADATSVDAYCNSQPHKYRNGPLRKISDPDATVGFRSATGRRKAGYFTGYSPHIIVCAKYRLPLFHRTETAREHESNFGLASCSRRRSRATRTTNSTLSKPSTATGPAASTATGPSAEQTPRDEGHSGVVRPASAPPRASGSGRASGIR